MPGMNLGPAVDNPTIIAAFRAALLHQGLIALLIFLLVGLAWLGLRSWVPAAARATIDAPPEPSWRKLLRYGFGVIWLLDGILQAQPKMVLGLPTLVTEPSASSSPHWVQAAVNWAGNAWLLHPIEAAASAVWIQVGIGVWLLAAGRGPLSRLGGMVSVGWGLAVWVFGESFGAIFGPGLTWLFGAPGAVLIYVVAGVLIALPERAWRSRLPGQVTMAGYGVFLLGMAVLQAWPGRGFWQGLTAGKPGSLAAMTELMAQTPQPAALSTPIQIFTRFDQLHGFGVNLFAVIALAVVGATFLTRRPGLIQPVLAGFIVLCVADWILIEDFGFLGGVGTDPNSMIPFALLATAGYLALVHVPAEIPATEQAIGAPVPLWQELRTAASPQAMASASIGSVVGVSAMGLIALGAIPMAAAQVSRSPDRIVAHALAGSAAPAFHQAKLTAWRPSGPAGIWTTTQAISVRVQHSSSA
jgi:hypothetical protein